jgi:hypothetical protein
VGDFLAEETHAGADLGDLHLVLGKLGHRRLGLAAERAEAGLDAVDLLLHPGEFNAGLLDAALGGRERDGDFLGAALLALGVLFELGNLFGPGLDLDLALVVQVGELDAAAFHLRQAAVEDLDLLAALGEFETGLGERFLLLVAVGALLGDGRLDAGNLLFLRLDVRVGLGELGLRLGQAG